MLITVYGSHLINNQFIFEETDFDISLLLREVELHLVLDYFLFRSTSYYCSIMKPLGEDSQNTFFFSQNDNVSFTSFSLRLAKQIESLMAPDLYDSVRSKKILAVKNTPQ